MGEVRHAEKKEHKTIILHVIQTGQKLHDKLPSVICVGIEKQVYVTQRPKQLHKW